jgi:anaerobic selenocysteine-containing dehydrogenase
MEILHPGEDRLRALIVVGGNPATAIAGSGRIGEALDSLELLLVLDPRLSETARRADYVIPTALPYERADLTSYADNWFYRDFAQYAPAAVDAPKGLIEDWEVFRELARRMGTPIPLKLGPYGVPRDRLPLAGDLDMMINPQTDDLLRLACAGSRLSFDLLRSQPSGVILEEHRVVRAAPRDDGARLELCPDDVIAEIRQLRAESTCGYPFRYRLITRRNPHLINSAFAAAGRVQARFPMVPVYMNPDDLASEGLVAGDRIRVISAHGQLTGQATADPTLKPGAIAMSGCWSGQTAGSSAVSLTSLVISPDVELEPINFMPRQSGVRVTVARAEQ